MIYIRKRGSRKQIQKEQLLDELIKKPFDLNDFKAFAALFSCDSDFSASKHRMDVLCRNYAESIDSCTVIAGYTGIDGARGAFIAVKLGTGGFAGYSGILQRCFMSRFLADTGLDAAIAAFHCEGEPSWRLSFVRYMVGFDAKEIKFESIPAKRSSIPAGEDLLHDPVQKQLHKLFLGSSLMPALEHIEQVFSQSVIAGKFINECHVKLQGYLLEGLSEGLSEGLLEDPLEDPLDRLSKGRKEGPLKGLPGKILNKCRIGEILHRYGFSTWESEANDEIAAIDGNILGGLFESLLGGKARKRSGTFYTPPEIVRYMCIEAISNYLANKTGVLYEELRIFLQYGEGLTDEDCRTTTRGLTEEYMGMPAAVSAGMSEEAAMDFWTSCKLPAGVLSRLNEIDHALAQIKVLDPATGAGAFLVSMLNEIVNARMNITEYLVRGLADGSDQEKVKCRKKRNPYKFRHHAIKNCLYAADIDDNAVKLTKLRLWLSLTDADGYADGMPGRPSFGMSKFPSFSELECNVICADSLLDEIKWQNWTNRKKKGKNRFNIVIGNPPYISAVEGARNDWGMREALRRKYPLLQGAFDIYTAFLLEGIEKTTADGAYCWIIPNKFMVSRYAEPVLNFMKNNGMRRTVSISDIGVFRGTGIYPIIVTGNKRSNTLEEYMANSLHALVYHNIKPKILPRCFKTFAEFGIRFASGATGFQARTLSGCIMEHVEDGTIPFIVSGSIDKFHIKYKHVRYMGRTYKEAYISRGESITENKWNLWRNDKIVIAGLTREIEAVYCTRPLALGVGVYAIYGFAGFNPLFLLGLLNSKYMSWYLNVRFSEKHLAGGYLAINKSTLERLPLLIADENTQSGIAEIVCRIQESAAIDGIGNEDMKGWLMQLDERVYRLYGLDNLEIKEIEDFFKVRK